MIHCPPMQEEKMTFPSFKLAFSINKIKVDSAYKIRLLPGERAESGFSSSFHRKEDNVNQAQAKPGDPTSFLAAGGCPHLAYSPLDVFRSTPDFLR